MKRIIALLAFIGILSLPVLASNEIEKAECVWYYIYIKVRVSKIIKDTFVGNCHICTLYYYPIMWLIEHR